jgi:hypothetical protein
VAAGTVPTSPAPTSPAPTSPAPGGVLPAAFESTQSLDPAGPSALAGAPVSPAGAPTRAGADRAGADRAGADRTGGDRSDVGGSDAPVTVDLAKFVNPAYTSASESAVTHDLSQFMSADQAPHTAGTTDAGAGPVTRTPPPDTAGATRTSTAGAQRGPRLNAPTAEAPALRAPTSPAGANTGPELSGQPGLAVSPSTSAQQQSESADDSRPGPDPQV